MALSCATADDVLKTIKDENVQMIDLRFTDLPGVWQHFSVPPSAVDADAFDAGIGFDGSSISGFQEIQESDMLVVPDPPTAFLDPFSTASTLVLICNATRSLAKAIAAIHATSRRRPRPTSRAAASASLPISDRRRSSSSSTRCAMGRASTTPCTRSNPRKAPGTPKEAPNLGHKPRQKEGYFPVPPVDSLQDLRSEMVLTMESLGIQIEAHHHEVATAGQGEIDMRFTTLTRMADNLMMYKYVVKNVARRHGMTATFMPKPLFEDNASGMHVQQTDALRVNA